MTYTLSQVTESVGTITLDHERRRNTGLPLGSFTRTTARSLSHHGRAQVVRSLPSVARPPKSARGTPKRVSPALQSGGSLGAFTWGVLDHLLEEEGPHVRRHQRREVAAAPSRCTYRQRSWIAPMITEGSGWHEPLRGARQT